MYGLISLVLTIAMAAVMTIGAVEPADAVTYTPAKKIEYTVFPPAGDIPKSAPFQKTAVVGDRIRITLTPHETLTQTPRILLHDGVSLMYSWHVMTPGTEPNSWTFTLTVPPPSPSSPHYSPHAFAIWFQIEPQPGDPANYVFSPQSFSALPPLRDMVSPEVVHAGFTRPDTIRVTFDERLLASLSTDTASKLISCRAVYSQCFNTDLDNNLEINKLAYVVSAPDGTNMPDDADGDVDVIPLLPSGVRYWHTKSLKDILIKLQDPAVDGTTYTVELPDSLTDFGGNKILDRTVDVTYTADFTAKTIDPTTTIVTFPSAVGGSLHLKDWSLTSDAVLQSWEADNPYDPLTSKLSHVPYRDVAHGKDVEIHSLTLGTPEDVPILEDTPYGFKRTGTDKTLSADSPPSAWWWSSPRLGVPDTSTERTMVIKHSPIQPSSQLAVSYNLSHFYPVYMHPGTGDLTTPPYVPYTWIDDHLSPHASRAMAPLNVDGASILTGITSSSDAWPPEFTARLTSRATTAIEFSEPVGGTARVSNWAIVDGAESRAVQSVRVGEQASAEGASEHAPTVGISAARTITLTHEDVSTAATPAVSYTRPAPCWLMRLATPWPPPQ